ncbi:tetratricopeptide repeat protein [Marinobacterium jannaschii]|uniref:tetratricopeptide repeat protein n=1 Tax=Marinobacterium jannaschii TaxID=64970 RepID=UPI00048638AD|nr:tetratricopeptide repeat protein [Marinobacterium jannaschii]
MSLINDMLRDLESRRADVSAPLQQIDIHAAPQAAGSTSGRLKKAAVSLVLLSILSVAGFLGWKYASTLLAWYEELVSAPLETTAPVTEPATAQKPADIPSQVAAPILRELVWTPKDQGALLTLTLNREPDLALLQQNERKLSFRVSQLTLSKPLVTPALPLIEHFGFELQAEGVRFDIATAEPVSFNLGVDALRHQVLIELMPLMTPAKELATEAPELAGSEPQTVTDTIDVTKPVSADTDSAVSSSGDIKPEAIGQAQPVIDYQALTVQRNKESNAAQARQDLVQELQTRTAEPQPAAPAGTTNPQAETKVVEEVFAQTSKPVKPKPIKRKPVAAGQGDTDAGLAARATRLLEQGRQQAAEALLRQGVKADKPQVKSRVLWAKVLLSSGRRGEADQVLDAGLLQRPDDSSLRQLKARSLLQDGQPAAALALLQSSPPPLKDEPEFFAMRAAIYQSLGQSESAASQYYQLLQFDSSEARWWIGMAYSLEQLGRKEQALQAYQNSLQAQNLDANLRQYVTQRMQRLVNFQE